MTILKKTHIKLKLGILSLKRYDNYTNYLMGITHPEEYNRIERLLDDKYYNLIDKYKKLK